MKSRMKTKCWTMGESQPEHSTWIWSNLFSSPEKAEVALGHDSVSQQAHQVERVCPRSTHVWAPAEVQAGSKLSISSLKLLLLCGAASVRRVSVSCQHDQAGSVTLHLNRSSSGREGLRGH